MKNKLKSLCAKINIETLAVAVMLLTMFNVLNARAAKFQAYDKPINRYKSSIEEFSDNDTHNIVEKTDEYNKLEYKNDLQFVSPTNKPNSTQTNPEGQGTSLEEQKVEESNTIPKVSTPTPTEIVFSPTATPIPTNTPTPTVQAANIQIWVRAWAYSTNGSQSAASGNVIIKNGDTELASGSTDANEVYKVSNMPTNSNLTVYFYLFNGCGQKKDITTGPNSTLHQVDFSFSSSTNCI